ncbi:MAG: 50S ribosome-binding GTPase [Kosmotogaceae bacterium]|nr:50S ribosome-binding GTPase [Kosmotogaceae bacterium]
MPINAGPEYFKAEEKYLSAKTKEAKIAALEEMIRKLPKHKGTQTMLGQLKKRLARLKKESTSQSKTKPKFVVRKDGAAQVTIIGRTNSGKSSLINRLTNADLEVGDYEYTTKLPEIGMMDYTGVGIQLVEIPSTFSPEGMSIVRTSDLVIILLDSLKDLIEQLNEMTDIMDGYGMGSKKILIVINKSDLKKDETLKTATFVSAKTGEGIEELKEKIWSRLDLIRVYTKSTKGKKADKPLTIHKDATVKDVVKEVHKTMLKNFKFARVFDKSKHSGRKVGLEYVLSDLDIVEIHAG